MDLEAAILQLYPNLKPRIDFVLQARDDGTAFIAQWNSTSSQPTQAQLDAQGLSLARGKKRTELILAFDAEYSAIWSVDGEVIEAIKDRIIIKKLNGTALTAGETSKLSQASTLISKLETKLADVRSATTEAQVQAIVW